MSLSDPITLTGTIDGFGKDPRTGARTLKLSIGQMDAAKVAQLSIYDDIAFKITFTPIDIAPKNTEPSV